jgi:hypothetical protein
LIEAERDIWERGMEG